MSIELCLFRHGRTSWNADGRYQGQTDTDLDDLGRAQALAVAERCQEIVPAALYSSDLRRCADVGARIAEATKVSLQLDPLLRERHFGEWQGLTRAGVAERFPDEFRAWQDGEDVCPPGGEAAADVVARVDAFLSLLLSEAHEGPVVVVTHGGWIRSAMEWVVGPAFPRGNFGVPTQASLTVIRVSDSGRRVLDAFNDRGHLLDVEDVDREGPTPGVY